MTIDELRNKITEANKAYRTGNAIISDYEYDALIDELTELNPHDDLLLQIGFIDDTDSRKQNLPIEMFSINKVKTVEDIAKWVFSKGIPRDTKFVLTPKYDGLSLCEKTMQGHAWTRGNGVVGQRSDTHLKLISKGAKAVPPISSPTRETFIAFGEVIMNRTNWLKYEDQFVNPRNMVSGFMNSKTAPDELEDCDFIRYGTNLDNTDKDKQLDICNQINKVKVPYKVVGLSELTEKYLKDLYLEWKKDYEIDGIIIDVNDANLRANLGRETGTQNPCYARAYKGNFEELKETVIKSVEWSVSKHGLLKPVGLVEPIKLDGATVGRVTLNNAKNVVSLGLGEGAKVIIKRSGQVIPFIVSVSHRVAPAMPTVCPSCGHSVEWNDNHIELVCNNDDCPAKRLNRIISFFDILEVENTGEGVCKILYDAGYNTIEKILAMSQKDMEKLDSFGERKAEIVYKGIHDKLQNVVLSKLQHASGYFKVIGSKKLKLLEHFTAIPTVEEIVKVEGFAKKSAEDYIQGRKKFDEFVKTLPVKIKEEEKPISDKYAGQVFVFTGFRNKTFEEIITKNGGKVGSSVSKTTTYLVMKEKGSGSSKEEKALKLGVKVMDAVEIENYLKG